MSKFLLRYAAFGQPVNHELEETRKIAPAPSIPAPAAVALTDSDPIIPIVDILVDHLVQTARMQNPIVAPTVSAAIKPTPIASVPAVPALIAAASAASAPTSSAADVCIDYLIRRTGMQNPISDPISPASIGPTPIVYVPAVPVPVAPAPMVPVPTTAVTRQTHRNPIPMIVMPARAAHTINRSYPATGISNPTQGGARQSNGQPASSGVHGVEELDKERKLDC